MLEIRMKSCNIGLGQTDSINYMIICKEVSELQREEDVLIVKYAVKIIALFNKKEKCFLASSCNFRWTKEKFLG